MIKMSEIMLIEKKMSKKCNYSEHGHSLQIMDQQSSVNDSFVSFKSQVLTHFPVEES